MTVESTLNKKIYMGNGITRHFPIPFFVAEASHIFLIVKDANGSRPIVNNFGVNLENKTVEYPLSGGALSISEELTIYRKVPLTQVVDLENAGAFHPKVLEHDGFDRIVMQVQQLAEENSRSIKVDINDEQSPSELLFAIFDAKEVAIQKAADADMSAQESAYSAIESLISEGKANESAKSAEKSSNDSKIWANIAETKADLSFNSALASQASARASALSVTASAKSACESMEYANSSMESSLESKEGARVSIEKSCESLVSADASDLSSQSAQASATAAATNAANSATSASESLTSANAAIESAISAKFWAVAELFENTEGSSKYWALQAGSGIPDATEIIKGKAQFATLTEAKEGQIENKVMSPYNVSKVVSEFFATGTRLSFNQAAAPTGWVKEIDPKYNGATIRFTTGDTVGTGGTQIFEEAFKTHAVGVSVTGNVGSTTLSEAQMPSHRHGLLSHSWSMYSYQAYGLESNSGYLGVAGGNMKSTNGSFVEKSVSSGNPGAYFMNTKGASESHTHSWTCESGTANINLAVKYVDCIICEKSQATVTLTETVSELLMDEV